VEKGTSRTPRVYWLYVNQTHAAKLLDISRDALRYKLKKFGLVHGEEEEAETSSQPGG